MPTINANSLITLEKRAQLTIERLKIVLNYNAETGLFTWLVSNSNRAKVGSVAGNKIPVGYIIIRIDGINHYAHRLAWFYMTGEWPKEQVDHKNTIKDDNRWVNLREATHAENQRNKNFLKNNKLKVKGVRKFRDKYRAEIWSNGKNISLGTFLTFRRS